MKHLLILGLLILLSTTTTWSQDSWVKVFGGTNGDYGTSITTTEDGGILITGGTESNDGDFEGMKLGFVDMFVIKLDKDGSILWKKTFGGSSSDIVTSLTSTLDGGFFLTGWTSSNDGDFKGMSEGGEDIFIIRMNSTGDIVWEKTYGGSDNELGYSVTSTEDGGLFITGVTSSNTGDFKGMSKGSTDIFIIKLNSLGKVEWKKTLGGSGTDVGSSLTTTSDGGFVLTGFTNSNDGDFEGMNKGKSDIFVIRLDTNGDVVWKRTFGGSGADVRSSLTTTLDGGFVLTGVTYSNDGDFKGMNTGGDYDQDIFIIKLNSNGEVLWKKTLGGSRSDAGNSLTTTSDGGIVLTGVTTSNDGDFKGMSKGHEDIFVIKLDNNGEVVWKRTFGGSEFDVGNSLTTTEDGGIVLTGVTTSNDGDFEGMSKGIGDMFVIKLDTNGEVVWKRTFGGEFNNGGTYLTTTSDGGIVLTGMTMSYYGDFNGTNMGEGDIFVIKLNPNGGVVWKKTFGGSSRDWGFSLTTIEDGRIVLTGSTNSNDGDFEGMNKGELDIFIMKLDKDGNLNPPKK